jgi:hypothetical protein
MKRRSHKAVFIVLALAVLVLLALVLKDSSDTLRNSAYDALAPTETKFARMARWIPPDSEFDVTIDVSKALANHELRSRLMSIVGSRSGVAAELVDALLISNGSIGLLTVAGKLGQPGTAPQVIVLAQGAFDKDNLLPVVRKAMTEGRAGLSAQDLGWSTLYSESDERHPFGFMILDGAHMAVGEKAALTSFFLQEPPPPAAMTSIPNEVLFGHLTIGPRLRSLAPGMLHLPESVVFSSADGVTLNANFLCDSAIKATSLSLFLEGIKALLLLQQEHNPALTGILNGLVIGTESTTVTITSKLAPLLKLWSDQSDEERNELAPSHVHKPPVGELEIRNDGKPQE